MIVSFNFYYARHGVAEAVLRQRLKACDVRRDLGLPRGRVLVRQSGSADLPDVIWEQQFDDVNGHLADMDVRAGSVEFESVRAGMRQLCRRFERPLFEVDNGRAASGDTARLVTLDWLYCREESDERVADTLRTQAGQALRLITPGEDLPRWIVKREHSATTEAPPDDRASVDAISSLVERVEHSAWRVE